MIPPSEMRHRVRFDQPLAVDDGVGGKIIGWKVGAFEAYAKFTWRYNGERVIADRLSGVQTVIISIYHTTAAAAINESWRAVDVATNERFNIRTAPQRTEDGSVIELLCQSGVADA